MPKLSKNSRSKAKTSVHPQMKADSVDVAQEILDPVIRFLVHSGIQERHAREAFAATWVAASRDSEDHVRLSSLEDPAPFVALMAAWSRNAEYLDKQGLPRDLPFRGKRGFCSLVRDFAPSLEPTIARDTLVAYGNVEVARSGRLLLIKPFFHIKTNKRLAFEPSVRFLVDAARNVKDSLNKSPESGSKVLDAHFWRAVDSSQLPKNMRRKYLDFVRHQSLTFLQNVDDWLNEHGIEPDTKSAKTMRVGLGLFTFESPPAKNGQ